MAYKDPLDERARAARRKHYESNKSQYLERNHAAKERKRAFLREAKSVPCTDCGMSYEYYVMDFDHRPGEGKVHTPSRLYLATWTALLEEVAKCDVVCANCHRSRTFKRGQHLGDIPP